MIAEYNQKSLLIGVPGLLLQIGCVIGSAMSTPRVELGQVPPPASGMGILWSLGSLVGLVMLIVGLGYYAKAKGYSPLFGLFGLLSCLGLLILALMKDKTLNKES